MKRFLSVVMLGVLSSALAWATPPQAPLTPVRATYQRNHHRAHRSGRHHHANRRHRMV